MLWHHLTLSLIALLRLVPAEEVSDDKNVPQIYFMQIVTNVTHRFARTLITSGVRNLDENFQEANFSIILPENAFISEFEMEIEEKVYKAYVEEKEKAEENYKEAKSKGQSAAHVKASARDSQRFSVSVNIEPEGKAIFRLLYEELLQRNTGLYEIVVNINPGQIVEDLEIEVYINESKPLTFVRTPALRTGNEIVPDDDALNPCATVKIPDSTSASVKFHPDANQQKKFAERLGGSEKKGFSGQFVVQYDVQRDPQGGEVLVRDGYFVHFFAPTSLQPLPKHVVFVLDNSGSMRGIKSDQLVDAMQNILSELKPEDLFDIVRFNDKAYIWNVAENRFSSLNIENPKYGQLETLLRELLIFSEAAKATGENIGKAKGIIRDNSSMTSTNIIAGLEVGLFLIKRTQESVGRKYQPMVIFLTDGLPNEGMNAQDEIITTVTELNSLTRAPIFSLSLGQDADKKFLRVLSSKNWGVSRHIYEASDVCLQLQNFYETVSSPLLSNVTFKYVSEVSNVTNTKYPNFFNGSELVVAGRIRDDPEGLVQVQSTGIRGHVSFNATFEKAISSLERLWAYLTVKKILKERDTAANESTDLSERALDMALKFSFVTPVTSLVVIKPNETDSVSFDNSRFLGNPQMVPVAKQSYIGRRGRMRTRTRSKAMVGIAVKEEYIFLVPRNFNESVFENITSLPGWLEQLWKSNDTISEYNATFKVRESDDVIVTSSCQNKWSGLDGICISVFDCPILFPAIDDLLVFTLQYCPLNKYAGICCPMV